MPVGPKRELLAADSTGTERIHQAEHQVPLDLVDFGDCEEGDAVS